MAKMWGMPKGDIRLEQRKSYSAKVDRIIDNEIYRKEHSPKLGIKASVLIVYAEKGKLAAWQTLQEYNKKLSGEGFTLEMLEQWIGEYEKKQQSQRVEKDDGFNR